MFAILGSILSFIVSAKFIVGLVTGTIGHKVLSAWFAAAKAKIAPVVAKI